MMREIEIAGLTTEDVNFDRTNKVVTLRWTVSKTDTKAQGVYRALQCICGQAKCDLKCPYAVLDLLCKHAQARGGDEGFLSMTVDGAQGTKKEIVQDWQNLFGAEVTGHSTRRSGALQCIRKGWTISQTAFLGRWKSNIILEYAQEALQSLAVNVGGKFDFGNGNPTVNSSSDPQNLPKIQQASVPTDQIELKHIVSSLQTDVDKIKKDTKAYNKELQGQVNELKEKQKSTVKYLPDLVKSLRYNTTHVNVKTCFVFHPRPGARFVDGTTIWLASMSFPVALQKTLHARNAGQ